MARSSQASRRKRFSQLDSAEFFAGEAFAAGELDYEDLEEKHPLLFHLIGATISLDPVARDRAVASLADLVAAHWKPRDPRVRRVLQAATTLEGTPVAWADAKYSVALVGVCLAIERGQRPVHFRLGRERAPLMKGQRVAPAIVPLADDFFPAVTPFWFRRAALAAAERYILEETSPQQVVPSNVTGIDSPDDEDATDCYDAMLSAATPEQREFLEVWCRIMREEELDVRAAKAEAARRTGRRPGAVRALLKRVRDDAA